MCPTQTRSEKHTNPANCRTAANDTTATANKSRAAAQLGWQTGIQMATAHSSMAFKNEVVSDADIDRYKLPFPKGEGRWWTRDAERDYYLWGGLVGNLAYDDMKEGRFLLYLNGPIFWVKILPGIWSESLTASPYLVSWETIARIEPQVSDSRTYSHLVSALKEALLAYGYEGQDDNWIKDIKVSFGF